MFVFSYTAAIVSVLCVVMAAVILFKKRDVLSVSIALYAIGAGVWNMANAFADVSWSMFTVRLWCGLALVGSMIFVVCSLIFLEQFLHHAYIKNKIVGFLIIVPAIFFCLLAFSPLYIVDWQVVGIAPTITVPGNINYAVLVYTVGALGYALWRLWHGYDSLSVIKKQQVLYMKAGFIFVLIAGVIFTIILPFLGYFSFFSVASQSAIMVVLLTVYSIYKHNFLDIRIVLRRGVIFAVLLGAVVSFYISILFIAQEIFFGSDHAAYVWSSVLTCLLGIFSVPKIDAFLRKATDSIFFTDRYDPVDVLARMSEIVYDNFEIDALVEKTVACIKEKLKIDRVYLGVVYRDVISGGETMRLPAGIKNISLVVPLEKAGRQIGVLLLGQKLSGDPFSEQDIELFKTFSRQMAVALEKARLYEQVKDYSKNLEEKIEMRTVELKKMQETQSQELYEIAHELQTPLTILKNDVHNFFAGRDDWARAQRLEKSIERISRFINSLLRLAKLEFAGQVAHDNVNLSELLNGLVEEFYIIAQGSNVTFQYQIVKDLIVRGDAHKLVELIGNLVSNAIKYTSNQRQVWLELERGDNEAVLRVRDTGIGISENDLPRIFDRFYRAGHAVGEGTGLGLAICKKIVLLHGGSIFVRSTMGQGTCIEVHLPLV